MRPSIEIADAKVNSVEGFQALAPLLRAVSLAKLEEVRMRVAKLDDDSLIERFRKAFSDSKRTAPTMRVLVFILGDELTRRGIPPWLRHHHLSSQEYSPNQQFDLFVQDVRYIRRTYPDHAKVVKFRRCKALFVGPESAFHAEAGFSFYGGNRAAWKVVKSLCLTEAQQLDCMWLRSAPIARRIEAAEGQRRRVFALVKNDLLSTRRTKTFTGADARAALSRRHRLWVCRSRSLGSPADIAKKYEQMTGMEISRQVVSRQLQLVDDVIKKARRNLSKKRDETPLSQSLL